MVGGIQSNLSVSSDIIAQMREKMFARLDGDSDGQIDLAELEAELNGTSQADSPQERLLEALMAADADGDGKVTKDEFASIPPPPRPTGSSADSVYGQGAEIDRSWDISGSLLDLCC